MDQLQPTTPTSRNHGNPHLLAKFHYYEQRLLKSLTTLVQNVSEFFHFQPYSNSNSTSTTLSDAVSIPVNYTYTPNSSSPMMLFLQKSTSDHDRLNLTLTSSSSLQEPIDNDTSTSNLTLTSTSELPIQLIITQLILLLFITFTLWLASKHVLKWSILTTTIEVILSWFIVTLTLPFAVLIFVPIFLARTLVHLYLTIISGSESGSGSQSIFLASPFDSVWSFEQPHSPSTCVGLQIIEGDGDVDQIRSQLNSRMILRQVNGVYVNDCFRRVLKTVFGFVVWEKVPDSDFDVTNHIRCISRRTGCVRRQDPALAWTEEDIFEEMGALHETSLFNLSTTKQRIPPWEILVIPRVAYGNGVQGKSYYGILFRVHHSMMDGISMGHIIHDCMADKPFKFTLDATAPLKVSRLTVFLGTILSIVSFPRILLKSTVFFEANAFHGRTLTGPKKFAWSRPLRLDTLKQLKNATGSTVFSVLLACIGGSLKKLYSKHGHDVPDLVHACPPIAILPYPNRLPRNRFSIVLYPVALGAAKSMLDRLEQVYKASKTLASSPDVLSSYYAVYILGLMPYGVLKLLAPLAHATFTFSNIPGPAESVQVLNGDKLVEIGAWIPVKNRIGIGMALFSYENRLRVTFIGDKAALEGDDDVQFLCSQFEAEITELMEGLPVPLKCGSLFIESPDDAAETAPATFLNTEITQ